MNRAKLIQLRDWLKDGASHVHFHMSYAGISLDMLSTPAFEAVVKRDKAGLGNCGTVCCIAGAIVVMNDDFTQDVSNREDVEGGLDWNRVCDEALRVLELDRNQDSHYGHPLFDSKLPPENCTPQEAAKAVQNLLDGVEPNDIWKNVRE